MSLIDRIIMFSIAAYLATAVFTFGHSAAHHQCREGRQADECDFGMVISTISASVAWPLYWSWQLQEQPTNAASLPTQEGRQHDRQ